jgi:hypothetical protein
MVASFNLVAVREKYKGVFRVDDEWEFSAATSG